MLRDRIEYAIFVLLSALVHWAPLRLTRVLVSGIARAAFRFGGRSVRDTMDNLAVAYPELPLGERRAIARTPKKGMNMPFDGETYWSIRTPIIPFLRNRRSICGAALSRSMSWPPKLVREARIFL